MLGGLSGFTAESIGNALNQHPNAPNGGAASSSGGA